MIMYLGVLRKSLKQINHRILTILLSFLPSDKSATPQGVEPLFKKLLIKVYLVIKS